MPADPNPDEVPSDGALAAGALAAGALADGALSIDVATLSAWRAQSVAHLLLDVREPFEVATAAIEGALTVPMGEVQERFGELPRGMPIVVMCHHGMRSLRVTYWLRSQGFSGAINLDGGIDSWSRTVDPSVPVY